MRRNLDGITHYAKSKLMRMTKAQLVDHAELLQQNSGVSWSTVEQQAQNLKGWAPVVTGHWITYRDLSKAEVLVCSECGALTKIQNNKQHTCRTFCWNCGASNSI